ncbi:toll-like receptor 3 [Ptychodera flava]|uniref:toll-like receptor 3 n=1 Tax=Ptychodera flava TaxID=63121 RepID=UPI003969CADD
MISVACISTCTSIAIKMVFYKVITLLILLSIISRNGRTTSAKHHVKSKCTVRGYTFDCSHMRLYKVPTNIPVWTKTLILSHNSIPILTGTCFQQLPNLEYLDMSYNSVARIDQDTFRTNQKLRTILLPHNEVTKATLPYGVFNPLHNLTELNLAFNRMKTIPEDMLINTLQLKNLNLAGNQLQSVNLGKDLNLSHLKKLNISHNILAGLREGYFTALKGASLSVLDLSYNRITDIENGTFLSVKSIKTVNVSASFKGDLSDLVRKLSTPLKGKSIYQLILRNLNLQGIDAGMFAGFESEELGHLDLSFNNITTLIDKSSFVGLDKLRYLVLDNNNLHHFDGGALVELKSLHSLSLNDNALSVLARNTFSSISSLPLKYLYIRNNKITSIEPGACTGLANLLNLNLYNNQIHQRLSADNFEGLRGLERLDLGHNKASLNAKAFDNLKNLTHLYLNLNGMTSINVRPSPFRRLTSLKTLDLSNNNMNSLAEDTLANLFLLETLYLQHNNLAGLWKESHPGGPLMMLENLTKLKSLHLGWNGFENVPGEAFKSLQSLTNLSLEHNKIHYLPDCLFAETKKLQQLDLQDNLITLVNKTNLEPFLQSLKVLNVANNTFSCSCDMEWFRKWVDRTTTELVHLDRYKCLSPPSLYKHPFLSYHPSPWICDHVLPMWAWRIIIPCGVVLVILIATCIRYSGYMKCLCYMIKAHRNSYSVLDGEDSYYLYDAYIACSDEPGDKEWVTNYLIPNVEECSSPKFKLYFDDRDRIGGGYNVDDAATRIEKSRKTICIVTSNFLNSEKCIYQRTVAIQQYFENHKDILILIFLDKVPQHELTEYERAHRFMNKKSYLQWPFDRGEQLAFWQKLKSVLGSNVNHRNVNV